ncbi:Pyocin activator protein PrtN [Methylobacterium sp. WL30]|uniref:pyocin activator PrtN family protein n=1 Tax=unclassified Methylobacterium TaxID=2615210 RepID=UPI0011CB648D|nr:MULTISPECIES: pyocin activator PrtN family protein [unclassified Methylobacterium]TXN38893.1 Pyocin activator protein PrtN [Methylobacterium sp. WL93]TXN47444.1 Pyocin activator protein PrtN [Methylobacterium sp. WL119]TXN61603.1 Pyocin activator protein PrtN [Methylobacterium sp. WL30]
MNTAFILMAQYGPRAVVPLSLVCRDYFSHLTPEKLVRKVSLGEIALPLVRIEASQKSGKGVGLMDLAEYLDRKMEAARKECAQLCELPNNPR